MMAKELQAALRLSHPQPWQSGSPNICKLSNIAIQSSTNTKSHQNLVDAIESSNWKSKLKGNSTPLAWRCSRELDASPWRSATELVSLIVAPGASTVEARLSHTCCATCCTLVIQHQHHHSWRSRVHQQTHTYIVYIP